MTRTPHPPPDNAVGRHITDSKPGQLPGSEAERLAHEQAALRRVATLVAAQASQERILSAIAAEIGPLIGIEETRLVRFVDDHTAETVASAGSSEAFPVGEQIPAGPGAGPPVARVLATGKPVWFDAETLGDGPVAATLRGMGVRSGVCAPIYVEGRLWGSINTGSPRDELAPDAESRLAQFTDLLATAIANTESRSQVERLAQEQAALRRVATLVAEDPESEAAAYRAAGLGHESGQPDELDGQLTAEHGLQNRQSGERAARLTSRRPLSVVAATAADGVTDRKPRAQQRQQRAQRGDRRGAPPAAVVEQQDVSRARDPRDGRPRLRPAGARAARARRRHPSRAAAHRRAQRAPRRDGRSRRREGAAGPAAGR